MSRPKPIPGIVKRDGTIVRYDRRRIQTAIFKATTAIGRPDPRLARDAARLVEAALIDTYGREQMPTVEDIQDIVERILLRTEALPVAHEYMTYRHAHAKLRAARVSDFGISENIPYRKIYEVLRWNLDHGCDSVAGLNRLIVRGKFAELVAASNRRYEDVTTNSATMTTKPLKRSISISSTATWNNCSRAARSAPRTTISKPANAPSTSTRCGCASRRCC